MKMPSLKRKVMIGGLALLTSFLFSTGALAAESDGVTKSNDVDAQINSGGFNLQTSPIKNFGDITIKLDDEKYSTGFETDLNIKDLRGSDDDWQLTVSSTPFTSLDNPDHVFDNVLSISPLDSIERIGDTTYEKLPEKVLNTTNVLDDGDVPIAKSENDSGMGEFSLTFPEDAIHLMVTPGMKEGLYESTLTWNLMSVPTSN